LLSAGRDLAMLYRSAEPRGSKEVSLGMSLERAQVVDLPDLDDRLVEPETRYEMLDGELVYVPPADDPHASREAQICTLVTAHVAPGFIVAVDLLTRTSRVDDIAPDVNVYPPHDPVTGRRQLQQMVFEVVSTRSMGNAKRKAAKLAARGVRRVFAVDVERSRALEWSAELGAWSVLDPAGHISDPVLAVPLPIGPLIQSVTTDDLVVRALRAKGNAVIEAIREEGQTEGRAEGKAQGRAEGLAEGWAKGMAEAVVALLGSRGVPLVSAERERILAERDPVRLERWIARAARCASADELLAEP
jgi:Uma2 family endonuclease